RQKVHPRRSPMKRISIDTRRRALLKLGAAATAAAYAGAAAAQGAPHVDEKDAQAQALGYKADATKVDKEKFKNYKPGETCSNCQQFQGKGKEEWAACTIFPGKQVHAKGWCTAYVKKA